MKVRGVPAWLKLIYQRKIGRSKVFLLKHFMLDDTSVSVDRQGKMSNKYN